MHIEANAVIEAYQERVKHLTHELMLAQAYIAAQSAELHKTQDAFSEYQAQHEPKEGKEGEATTWTRNGLPVSVEDQTRFAEDREDITL